VATMHRMIKVMGAMLRSGEAYRDGKRSELSGSPAPLRKTPDA
jgi:hypothetical protein